MAVQELPYLHIRCIQCSPARGSPQQEPEQAVEQEPGVERAAAAAGPDKPPRQPRKKDPKLDLDLLEVREGVRGALHRTPRLRTVTL